MLNWKETVFTGRGVRERWESTGQSVYWLIESSPLQTPENSEAFLDIFLQVKLVCRNGIVHRHWDTSWQKLYGPWNLMQWVPVETSAWIELQVKFFLWNSLKTIVCQLNLQNPERTLFKADSLYHTEFNLNHERRVLLSRLDKRADLILPLAEQPEVLMDFSLCLLVLESNEDQALVNNFSNTYSEKLMDT